MLAKGSLELLRFQFTGPMHAEARAFVERVRARYLPVDLSLVVEYGSRDINGSVRDIFSAKKYIGIDLIPGKGVDVIGDAGTWRSPTPPDVIVCCELLEHTASAERIARNMCASVAPGGFIIITCACDPRAPHSAQDGGTLREGEHYENIKYSDLSQWIDPGFDVCEFEEHGGRGDLYVIARKRT